MRLSTSFARCSRYADKAVLVLKKPETHPTGWSKQFDGKACCPMCYGECWRTQSAVPEFWCLVARGAADDSEPLVACPSQLSTPLRVTKKFHPKASAISKMMSRCCASRRRSQKIGTPVFVSLTPFTKSAAVHFTLSLSTTIFFRWCEQREYVERCSDGWPNICHSSACEHGTISAFLHLFSRAARLLSNNHQGHRVCRPLQAHRQ